MDAKELHDFFEIDTAGPIVIHRPSSVYSTILRALSLLASVEGSGEEVVRELQEVADDKWEGHASPKLCGQAAAHIIALKARAEKAGADARIYREAQATEQSFRLKAEAELASVKGRAEKAEERAQWWRNKTHEAEAVACDALASFNLTQHIEDYPEDHWSHRAERFRAYRAAHPKEGA